MKLSLLHSLEEVPSSAKAHMLLPVADELANPNVGFSWLPVDETANGFISLVLGCLDATAADVLNDRNGKAWEKYQKIVRWYYQSSQYLYIHHLLTVADTLVAAPSSSRAALSSRLQNGLFAKLRVDRKVDLCKLLLEQGQESSDIVSYTQP